VAPVAPPAEKPPPSGAVVDPDATRRQAEAEAQRLRSDAEAVKRQAEAELSRARAEAEAGRATRAKAEADATAARLHAEAEADAARIRADAEAAAARTKRGRGGSCGRGPDCQVCPGPAGSRGQGRESAAGALAPSASDKSVRASPGTVDRFDGMWNVTTSSVQCTTARPVTGLNSRLE
jgi:hypothetical protein